MPYILPFFPPVINNACLSMHAVIGGIMYKKNPFLKRRCGIHKIVSNRPKLVIVSFCRSNTIQRAQVTRYPNPFCLVFYPIYNPFQ